MRARLSSTVRGGGAARSSSCSRASSSPPIVADTGGLLRGLANRRDGEPRVPEYAKVLTSASLVYRASPASTSSAAPPVSRGDCSRSSGWPRRWRGGGVLLISTETFLEARLPTARSGLPSSLKSLTATEALTATEEGIGPAPKFHAAWKVPLPLPSSTETRLTAS